MHSARGFIVALAAAGMALVGSAYLTGVAAAAPLAEFSKQTSVPREQQTSAQNSSARVIGTIQSIAANTITLKTDAGQDVSVETGDATKMVRVAPGQTTLQGATAIHLQDLQVGDRILVRGEAGDGGKSLNAASIIVMKRADLDAKHIEEQQAWQRGVGGLVKSVDVTGGTIMVTVASLSGAKSVTIHTTKDTILRRYAPDSVKFDDAKPGSIEQVHAGDQLRARGTRSADGNEFDALEIVSGAFRNIAGTITAVDISANIIKVQDLISKRPLLVRFTPQSEVRQLAPEMAQRIAMRLRTAQGEGQHGDPAQGAGASNRGADGAGQRPGGFQRGGAAGGDLQQMLSRLPPASLAKLQKDEAVMIVSTEGAVPGEVTAITLLGGVDPILRAAPGGAEAMTLSPWSLSAPSGGGDQ